MLISQVRYLGLEYRLEKQDEPGVAVDLDLSLSALRTTDFCLLRANSMFQCSAALFRIFMCC